MKLDTRLSDLERTVSLCIRDGMCTYGTWPENQPICSIYSRHRVYTASGGGLVYLVRALAENKIDCTPTMAEYAYECPLCEACDMCEIIPVAPPHATPSEVIRFLRHQLVQQDAIPEGIRELYKRIKEKEAYEVERQDLMVPESIRDERASTVLFLEGKQNRGDHLSYQSAIRIFEKMGEHLTVFNQGPSGYDLYDLGFWDELDLVLQQNKEELRKLDGKTVVFLDPHSQEFMTKRYPQITSEKLNIEARHLSEVLSKGFKDGKLRPKGEGVTISYHDPCRLSRGLGIYDAPRELLSMVGVELVEMKRAKENTYCCGTGGRYPAYPDFSDWVAAERIREFEDTGAELLITACPHCREQFKRALGSEQSDRIKDLFEFVEWRTE